MQRRSWMAALTSVALAWSPSRAEDPAPAPRADKSAPANQAPASIRRTVALNLNLTGLNYESTVTIKPGNPACRFEPVTIPVKYRNRPIQVKPIEVEVFSADRDCSMVITLNEGGQPPKTMRRTFRVEPADPAKPGPQVYDCYLTGLTTKAPAAVAAKDAGKPAPTRK